MRQIFKNIFTVRNLTFLFVGLFLFDLIDPTNIAAAANDDTVKSSTLQSLGEILSLVIKMLTFLATFMIAVGGELMGTDLIIGGSAEEGLKHVWVFMRNITNIGFILVLIYLAMSNLFAMGDSGGSWNWTIKDKLPKLIIALIAINGSFLAFKVAIQAVDVGTVAILSISDTALETKQANSLKQLLLETKVNDFTNKDDETAKTEFYKLFNDMMCKEGTGGTPERKNCLMYIDKNALTKMTDDPLSKNILVAFGVHFMHLEQLPGLAADLGSLTQVLDNTLFAALMAAMFVVALLAMFIVMILRVAALWLFIAFSPIIVAGGIMGVGDGGSNIAAKIVTYLIIPLKISAVFAITFIMMSVLGDYTATIVGGGNTVMLGDEYLKLGDSMNGVSLFTLLWQLMIVAIFWQGAFWALKDTEAQSVVDSIKGGAEKVGGFALKTATVDRPMFKTGKMKGLTLGGALNMPSVQMDAIRNKRSQDQRKIAMGEIGMGEQADTEDKVTKKLKTLDAKTKTGFKEFAKSISTGEMTISEYSISKIADELNIQGEKRGSFINSMKNARGKTNEKDLVAKAFKETGAISWATDQSTIKQLLTGSSHTPDKTPSGEANTGNVTVKVGGENKNINYNLNTLEANISELQNKDDAGDKLVQAIGEENLFGLSESNATKIITDMVSTIKYRKGKDVFNQEQKESMIEALKTKIKEINKIKETQ